MGEWVAAVIKKELRSKKNVSFELEIPVKPRVKATESFIEKALHRDKKYSDPLGQIQDQVGVRFVFLLQDQVSAASDIIKSIGVFRIDNERDPVAETDKSPERFGYKSVHFVVYPVCELPFKGGKVTPDIPCEIQVRTLLQHTFAQISHECNYKPSLDLPDNKKCKLQRVLAQGAALTEVTDAVFAEVKHEIDEYSKHANELFGFARKRYAAITKTRTPKDSPATLLFLDAYRKELNEMTLDAFKNWLTNNRNLLSTLKARRNESAIYTEPVVLLLGYLADRNPRLFRDKWFSDPAYLSDIGLFFGTSLS